VLAEGGILIHDPGASQAGRCRFWVGGMGRDEKTQVKPIKAIYNVQTPKLQAVYAAAAVTPRVSHCDL
jgi:hypothetical protein